VDYLEGQNDTVASTNISGGASAPPAITPLAAAV